MSDALKDELFRQLYSIEDKWKQRQRLEEELGIPTSDELTLQYIREESAEILQRYMRDTINKKIKDGELFGVR